MASLEELLTGPQTGAQAQPQRQQTLEEMLTPGPQIVNVRRPGPDVSLRPSAEVFLAGQVGQKTLGPDALSAGERFDLARSATFEDQRNKFKAAYPKGEFVQIPVPNDEGSFDAGNTVTLFTKDYGVAPFSRLDPVGPEIGDVAEAVSSVESLIGEVAGAIATRGRSFLTRTAGTGSGGLIGEGIKRASERLRGYDEASVNEELANAALTFTSSAIGSAVGDTLGATLRVVRGGAHANPVAAEADRIARELDLPRLMGGQISATPIVQRMFNQASAKAGIVGRKVAVQLQAAGDRIKQRVNPAALTDLKANLAQYDSQMRALAMDMLRVPGTSLEQTGRYFTGLMDQWNGVASGRTKALFGMARTIAPGGGVQLDVREMKQLAQRSLALQQAGQLQVSGEMGGLLQRIVGLPDVMGDVPVPDPVVPGQQIIRNVEDVLSDFVGELWTFRHTAAGGTASGSTESSLARQMYDLANQSLSAPVGASPQFARAWGEATQAQGERMANLELFDALLPFSLREFRPSEAVKRLYNVNDPDTVIGVYNMLKRQGMVDQRWTPVQVGFRAELINVLMTEGPEAAIAKLGALSKNPGALNLLMTAAERRGFEQALQGLSDLQRLGIKEKLATQAKNTNVVLDLVKGAKGEQINTLLKSNPPGSPLHESIRNGLIDYLASHRTMLRQIGALKNVEVLDGRAISKALGDLNATGAIKFLTEDDIGIIGKLAQYLTVTSPGTDMAAGLAAGEVASGFMGGSISRSISSLLHAGLLGRFITSGPGRVFMVGFNPGQRSDPFVMRAFGAALGDMASKEGSEKSRREGVR